MVKTAALAVLLREVVMDLLLRFRSAFLGLALLWVMSCSRGDGPSVAPRPNPATEQPTDGARPPENLDGGVLGPEAGDARPSTVPDSSAPADGAAALPDDAGQVEDAAELGDAALVSDGGTPLPVRASWPSFGGDYAHTRASPGEQRISTVSVRGLQRAWERAAPGVSATPAILEGIVYWSDWAGGVHANRVDDGTTVWSQQLPVGFTGSPFVGEARVYVADRTHTVYALERTTGRKLWAATLDDVALTQLWSSPIVVDDVLVVGSAAKGTMDNGQAFSDEQLATSRGAVVGLNAQTGGLLWRFETTRVKGDSTLYGPGVSVWSTAAVDQARGLLFIGTGNGYAEPVSPYSNALLALEYKTGALVWCRQFSPDDAFHAADLLSGPDYDVGAAPNLFTIQHQGQPMEVVGVGDKSGTYHVLARDSGAVIWETVLEPVDFLRKTGGIIAPAAYAEGRIFVASNTSHDTSKVWALDATTGRELWQSATINSVNFGAPAVANGVLFFGGSGLSILGSALTGEGVGGVGELVAFAADSGEVLFRSALRAGRGGGFSIADGHVFVGSGFSFYVSEDEPVAGFLEVFVVP
jgi:polyvinyl alcohol dehydrogenase (cytochrome)